MMFERKAARMERERLKASAEVAKIERENAKIALHCALRKLAQYLEEIPLDDGISELYVAMAVRERDDDGG